ncbi:hypothetical protein N1851_012456 [Merluccius polli]|uniref:Uncharacterized protein n=1 Tax=Merluccius polli TaxID=89951 RepID=A0AA47MXH1_MERPO|nr:hypothetical protein N1851_012456 [Merluccius polli]
MKLVPVLAFLSVSVMVVMIFQAVRQELRLQSLKNHMLETSAELKKKEQAIIEEKNKIQDLSKQLAPLNNKKDELNQRKVEINKSLEKLTNSLLSCNTDKEVAEKKKVETTQAISKVKGEYEEARKKAEEEIQQLKQQILDRDNNICTFVDETKEEGR